MELKIPSNDGTISLNGSGFNLGADEITMSQAPRNDLFVLNVIQEPTSVGNTSKIGFQISARNNSFFIQKDDFNF